METKKLQDRVILKNAGTIANIGLIWVMVMEYIFQNGTQAEGVVRNMKRYYNDMFIRIRRMAKDLASTSDKKQQLNENGLQIEYYAEYYLLMLEALYRATNSGKINQFLQIVGSYAEINYTQPDVLHDDMKAAKAELLAKFHCELSGNSDFDSVLDEAYKFLKI